MSRKNTAEIFVKKTLLLFICIAVNILGRWLAARYSLPGWLDSFGTFTAAYAYGPIAGAIIGVTSNIISVVQFGSSAWYCPVSVLIGILVGILARKGYFETLFHTMTVAGAVTAGAVLITSVLDLAFFEGSTGNIWGDGVRDYLVENNINRGVAVFAGEFYLEFPDKLVISLMLFILLKAVRRFRGRRSEVKSVASALVCLVMTGVFLSQGAANASAERNSVQENFSYVQTVFNSSNGLQCGHANAIAQTNDGILWIGTYAGLYRYNGSEFEHMDEFDEIRNVNCLYVDNEGRLWVGTNDNGVAIVINGEVTNVINTVNGLPSESIKSIVQGGTGEYYIGTSDGIVTYELKMGFSLKADISTIGYTNVLSADSMGNVAAVNNNGELFYLNKSRIVYAFDGDNDYTFSTCAFGPDDELYIGTDDGSILRYSVDGYTFTLEEKNVCEGLSKINNIYPRRNDRMWICADNGIGYMDTDGSFVRQESGDFNYSIQSMVEDYQGNLWFASLRLGLLRLSRSAITDVFADNGIAPSVVNTTAVYGNMLYAGTDDGLCIIDMRTHKLIENELTEILRGSRIRSLQPSHDGGLWVCSYGVGLVKTDITGAADNWSDRIKDMGSRVRVCTELSDGTIAVSSSEGIFLIKDSRQTKSFRYGGEIGYSQVLCFLETQDGTLLAGTDGSGIFMIKDGRVIRHISRDDGLPSEVILRMVKDPEDGSVFIVTSNSICRMAGDKVNELKAFPYSNNYDVMIDDDGELFIPGSAGIYVVDKHKLIEGTFEELALLDMRSGLPGSLTANAWNGSDGKCVYLSADRGVYKVDLDGYLLNQRAFRLTIPQIKLDDRSITPERGSVITVGREVAKIEFFPELINYTFADPVVSYRLDGFDPDWVDLKDSELLSIPYTNLPPGDYTFRLAVRDENGMISEESTYSLTKEKAIYDNIWFKYYMIAVAVVFIGWLTWFITRTQVQRTLEIQQAKLSMALQQVQMGNETILAIAKTVDAKDERTSQHSQRVSEYSAMIAREYGFTEAEQENIRKAALLHDIGKIGIPDSVLNKPGRLTDDEYAIMKTHVTRGAEILKDLTLIDHVVEGARYHHERYDGRGYPDGLKGEDIPLYGRIIAIADAFDAMTANRVYRKRQDFDYVMGELHKGRGTQFDPELLDIFLKLIDDKKIDIDALYSNDPAKEE